MKDNIFFKDLLINRLHLDEVRKYLSKYTESAIKKMKKEMKKRRPALRRKDIEEKEGVKNRERNIQGILYEHVSAKLVEAI